MGIKHDVFLYTGKNLGFKVGSTERHGVKVDDVTLPMTTIVLLVVHLEICNQYVFLVTECVVECHRALVVGGTRRLWGRKIESQTVPRYENAFSRCKRVGKCYLNKALCKFSRFNNRALDFPHAWITGDKLLGGN